MYLIIIVQHNIDYVVFIPYILITYNFKQLNIFFSKLINIYKGDYL